MPQVTPVSTFGAVECALPNRPLLVCSMPPAKICASGPFSPRAMSYVSAPECSGVGVAQDCAAGV